MLPVSVIIRFTVIATTIENDISMFTSEIFVPSFDQFPYFSLAMWWPTSAILLVELVIFGTCSSSVLPSCIEFHVVSTVSALGCVEGTAADASDESDWKTTGADGEVSYQTRTKAEIGKQKNQQSLRPSFQPLSKRDKRFSMRNGST